MTVIADLHVRSAASDGQYTPSEAVWLAKGWEIEVLALTGYDTLDSLEEAVQTGGKMGALGLELDWLLH